MIKKKAEVHLHIDGSLEIMELYKMLEKSKKYGSIEELYEKVSVTGKESSLTEYLTKFDIPLMCMQNMENIRTVVGSLCKKLENEEYIYSELRFAPHLHNGVSREEAVEAVLEGIKNESIKNRVGVILCIMRHLNEKSGFEIVELAEKYGRDGVIGIDIAGDERYGVEKFEKVLKKAKEIGIKVTVHAGEAAGAESVKKAVEYGADRIGHGIRAIEDLELCKELCRREIMLEICPKSNLDTKVYPNFKQDYPIRKLYEMGVKIGLNCDNRTVSNTNLENESRILIESFGFNDAEIKELIRNNIKYGFCNVELKKRLLEEFDLKNG